MLPVNDHLHLIPITFNISSNINLQYLIFLQTLLFALFADQVSCLFTPVILATHFEMLLIHYFSGCYIYL